MDLFQLRPHDIVMMLAVLLVVLFLAFSIFVLGPDQMFEEVVEDVIERKTGFEIDLTPQNLFPGPHG